MKKLELWTVIAAATFGMSLSTLAEEPAEQWGSWDKKIEQKDSFFSSQNVSETELIQGEVSVADISSEFSAAETHREGNNSQGLDTDPNTGVPLELLQHDDSVSTESSALAVGGSASGNAIPRFGH
jgi:hypothetical protein